MKKLLFMVIALWAGLVAGFGNELSPMEAIKIILLSCRRPEDVTPSEALKNFARTRDLTNEEMSSLLLELVKGGLGGDVDCAQRELAYGALWGLADFGGEAENDFVKGVMLSTEDTTLRHIAVRVGIRMMPEKWEEWVEEAARDDRFDTLTRFDAYEEAYRIGQNGNEQTRKRVEEVLSDFSQKESSVGNRMDLHRWTSDLKAR